MENNNIKYVQLSAVCELDLSECLGKKPAKIKDQENKETDSKE